VRGAARAPGFAAARRPRQASAMQIRVTAIRSP
jgi:hypothetical protein